MIAKYQSYQKSRKIDAFEEKYALTTSLHITASTPMHKLRQTKRNSDDKMNMTFSIIGPFRLIHAHVSVFSLQKHIKNIVFILMIMGKQCFSYRT